ncbi:MAG: segregation/condensation protein A [Oscillospiraceae bacterium]|jgi:segregation and condensation protein A|nr:segregation/condensation protein A [Oscillospiraceae bacterium]
MTEEEVLVSPSPTFPAFVFKLDSFEGPMDLLLHLVTGHKLDVADVPIYTIIEQYLDIIRETSEQRLDIASEFLDMAARLVLIKTAALLPRPAKAEEMAEELRQEIIDYQSCKELAQGLSERAQGFDIFTRPAAELPEEIEPYNRIHAPRELLAAYFSAVGKATRRLPPTARAFSGIIAHTIVSVMSRYSFVFAALEAVQFLRLEQLLSKCGSRSERIATFLAVLTLCKAHRITAVGQERAAVLELQPDQSLWQEIQEDAA